MSTWLRFYIKDIYSKYGIMWGATMVTERQQALQKKMGQNSALKSVQIISALLAVNDYLSISEIAQVTNLSASTVHRILQELLNCDFVVKDDKQKKYCAGFESVAMAVNFDTSNYLLEAAKSEMDRLSELSLETVNLIALDGYQGVYIGKVEAKSQIGLRSKVGWKIPLYCTAGGKLLLAFQTEQWLEEYCRQVPFKQYTDQTLVDDNQLKEELNRIRLQKHSVDNREHNPDIICLAAPIFVNNGKVVATIGISAPDYRFPLERALSYRDEIVKAASVVTNRLMR